MLLCLFEELKADACYAHQTLSIEKEKLKEVVYVS